MFNPIRTLARQMLASMFIVGGLDALTDPESKVPRAKGVVDPLSDEIPQLDSLDAPEMVRLNGAVQVAGGVALALGKMPRTASAALAASLVPTTLAGHRFWEETDPAAKANQQVHFFKNVSMLGGLLLGVLDTEGRPGFAWRTKHAAEHAGIKAGHAKREAELKADALTERTKRAAVDARTAGKLAKQRIGLEAKHQADTLGTRTVLAKKKLTPDIVDAKRVASALRD